MNIKAFFGEALSSALDIGLGTPEDVLKYVTPDVLAQSLPRPLWARLFTACLGAPKVDAQLVVETLGVPNLCEHVSTEIIWACISQIANKALGRAGEIMAPRPTATASTPTPTRGAPAATPSRGVGLAAPPPASEPVAVRSAAPPSPAAKTNIPAPGSQSLANLDLDDDDKSSAAGARSRTPTGQRFRQASTGIGRLGSNTARRPQAQAAAPTPVAPSKSNATPQKRSGTEVNDVETEVGSAQWEEREIAVDDEQLVDWQSAEETITGGEGVTRKR